MTISKRRAAATRRPTATTKALRRTMPIPGPVALACAVVLLAGIGWVDQILRGVL